MARAEKGRESASQTPPPGGGEDSREGARAGGFDREKFFRDASTVANGFWRKTRRTIGRVPFSEDAVASYYCARDPKTPLQVKAILMGALAYFVVPTDMMPDVLPMLGFTDDATVLYAAIRSVLPHVSDEHRIKARTLLDQGLPDDENDEPFEEITKG